MTDEEPIQPPAQGELPWVIEALLFVAESPLTAGALAQATGTGEGTVKRALRQLSQEYEARGLRLMDDGGRYQLVTAPQFGPYVERLIGVEPGQRLSRAGLEVLTIIAYRQPTTRGEIEAIRGVNSDRLVATLEARGLVEEAGTATTPGRPKLYRTTMRFLEHFGIASPRDLPPLPDVDTSAVADPL